MERGVSVVRGFTACVLAWLAVGFAGAAVRANVIAPGVYSLNNLPDAVSRPPLYGLRINDLFDVNPGKTDVFTFDFNAPGSAMFLDYNGSSFHLYGTSFGGLNRSRGYDPGFSGFWNIDFTYNGVTTASGGTDLVVPTGVSPNTGSIQYIADPAVNQGTRFLGQSSAVTLYDYAPASAYTFRLGDNVAGNGGRFGNSGLVGGGWVTNGNGHTNAASFDWLFTLNPVPLPGGVLLAVAGLMSAGVAGLRRTKQSS